MWLVLKLKVFLKTIMENGLYILKVALESRGYANLFGFRGRDINMFLEDIILPANELQGVYKSKAMKEIKSLVY